MRRWFGLAAFALVASASVGVGVAQAAAPGVQIGVLTSSRALLVRTPR